MTTVFCGLGVFIKVKGMATLACNSQTVQNPQIFGN